MDEADCVEIAILVNNEYIQGPIPSEFGNMRALQSIDLQNNGLSGILPSEVGIEEHNV